MIDNIEIINQISSIKRKNEAISTKSKILIKPKNHDFPLNSRNMDIKPSFFIFKARLAFTKLRQAFLKALILYYFDSECYI